MINCLVRADTHMFSDLHSKGRVHHPELQTRIRVEDGIEEACPGHSRSVHD